VPFLGRKNASRALRAVAAAVMIPLLATACSQAAAEGESRETTPPATQSGGAFPVTIDHALGSTEIPAEPQRVVTLGWASQDTVLALGTTPVGIAEDAWAGDDNGLLPWTDEAITRNGNTIGPVGSDADVAVYADAPEVNIEELATLNPDLILATYSGITQEEYDQLSKLAPTVAYPETPWLVSWQDQTLINGRALGKADEAEELIAETQELIYTTGAEHAELPGTTFAFIYSQDDGTVGIYLAGDPRVDLLIDLGMFPAPSVSELDTAEGKFYAEISLENIDMLDDADVIVTWFNSEEEQAQLEDSELFQDLPAVKNGAYVPLLDRQLSMAVSTSTALSIPWSLEAFVPPLVEAVNAAHGTDSSDSDNS